MNEPASICAYCGQCPEEITRDHVVPRAMWGGKGLPSHVVVVPACRPCQERWDLQATYFRNTLIAMMDKGAHPVANRVLEEKVVSSLGRDRKAQAALFHNPRMVPRMSPGGLFLGKGLGFDLDWKRFATIPEKIVRGLFYFKSKAPLPSKYAVRVYVGNTFWEIEGFQSLLAAMEPSGGFGDDVFQVRCTLDKNDLNCTVWCSINRWVSSLGQNLEKLLKPNDLREPLPQEKSNERTLHLLPAGHGDDTRSCPSERDIR
jgi:hypothetical protein